MLAEIFLLRLQNALRDRIWNEATTSKDQRFVPLTLPRPDLRHA